MISLIPVILTFNVSCSENIENIEKNETASSVGTTIESATPSDSEYKTVRYEQTPTQLKTENQPNNIQIFESDINAYQDLNKNTDFSFMTGVYTVQHADELSSEQKLSYLGSAYFGQDEYSSEQNNFKKRDIAEALLPRIEAEIDRYKKEFKDGFNVKLPIIYKDALSDPSESKGMHISSNTFTLNQYDFEKKSFPIDVCYNSYKNQGFLILWENDHIITSASANGEVAGHANWPSTFPKEAIVEDKNNNFSSAECGLLVNDENQARKIEEAILNDNVAAKGYVYYHVPIQMGTGSINFEPVLVDIDYYKKDTNEVIANKRLTW